MDLVILILPGHHRDMVTQFPTGPDLILVPLVLNLASSVPGVSGSTWASPVTCDSDPKHGLTSLVTVVPNGTSPGHDDFGSPLGLTLIW